MPLLSSFTKNPLNKFHLNSSKTFYMNESIKLGQGSLGPHGELVVMTGTHTGRSANDKFVVKTEKTKNTIWWENNLGEMSIEDFNILETDVIEYLSHQKVLYATQRSIGNSKHFSLNIETITEMPSSAMFTQYMFKESDSAATETYGILHAPFMKIDPKRYKVNSPTVIVTCFEKKLTIIIGSLYAGEIKKSMFSIMNYLTPENNILPMHSGASQNSKGDSFVFFGLSGTGKTTLSTDEGVLLIGDDEHGLSDKGLFNFEGGCYAKTYKLAAETEPAIYSASTRFTSFLENVVYDSEKSKLDFFDSSITENGRSSYPLSFIDEKVSHGVGAVPKALFFLSADAFGVLPPLARLSTELAMKYFVLGYTAKLAGTEVGVKTPKAAFSPCFGAPFMLRHPTEYAKLLAHYINKYQLKVYLVNTGWTGGEYGVGQRFPLAVTRRLIRAVQAGELESTTFEKDPVFGFEVPLFIEGVDSKILNPMKAWSDEAAYLVKAKELQNSFVEQMKKF